jgi:hypothetical protein
MNLWINPVDVASGALCPITLALEDVNAVAAAGHSRSVKGEAQFDWHIESGNAAREFDAGQIVDGKIGLLDQVNNGFQSALVRNRKGGVDAKTKLSQADEVGKI